MNLRKLHSSLAPIFVIPVFITATTGALFQVAATTGHAQQYLWLLDLHRGKFGRFNLEMIYPFLNSFGLLVLAVTGILMWLRTKPPRRKQNSTSLPDVSSGFERWRR